MDGWMDVMGNIGEVDEIWFMGEMADISVTGYMDSLWFTGVHLGLLGFCLGLPGFTWVHLSLI